MKRTLLIGAGVLLFLVVSALLARFLTVENAERNDDEQLLQAQARGDVNGVLGLIGGCRASPSCVATVSANARNPRLIRAGEVKILQLQSPTAYSLLGSTGKTRLAWTVIGTLPVVQCVTVRRTGNFLTGVHVTLTGISAPIPNEGECTPHHRSREQEEEEQEEQGAAGP
jgi:hypothetical protein